MKCYEMWWNVMKCMGILENKSRLMWCFVWAEISSSSSAGAATVTAAKKKSEAYDDFYFFGVRTRRNMQFQLVRKSKNKKNTKNTKNKKKQKKFPTCLSNKWVEAPLHPPVSGGSERAVEASKGSDEDGDQWALRSNIKHSTTNIDEQLSKRTTAAIEQLSNWTLYFFSTKPSIDLPRKIPFHSIPIEH